MSTQTKAKYTPGPLDIMEGKTLLHLETAIDNPIGAGIAICSLAKSKKADALLYQQAPAMAELLQDILKDLRDRFPGIETVETGMGLIADYKEAQRILAAIEEKQ